MLAHDGAKHPKKIVGECFIEYKYDGVRVIAIVRNGDATLYSRNGKLLENFPHINEALSRPEFEGLVFDGEVMSEDFQTLMKQVHRKEGAQTEDSYLAVFDMLTLAEFNAGGTDMTAFDRRERLISLQPLFNYRIQLVEAVMLDLDTDKGQESFKAMNKQALAEGYEGLMIKPIDQGYKCKRSHAWLKIKPFIEVTLKVVALEEGTGKNKGKRVNNCVKEDEVTLDESQDFHEEFGFLGYSIDESDLFEAEYQGRTVKLNKPTRGDVKKFKVYVKDPKTGNVKKVNFGHGGSSAKSKGEKTMKIRKSNPKARKSFRARHNCDNPGPKTKARYWSCRKW